MLTLRHVWALCFSFHWEERQHNQSPRLHSFLLSLARMAKNSQRIPPASSPGVHIPFSNSICNVYISQQTSVQLQFHFMDDLQAPKKDGLSLPLKPSLFQTIFPLYFSGSGSFQHILLLIPIMSGEDSQESEYSLTWGCN